MSERNVCKYYTDTEQLYHVQAIHAPRVSSTQATPAHAVRAVGFDEQRLPSNVMVQYLYAPGELEGGERRRATDPVAVWSVTVHSIDRSVVKSGEPVLYYLMPARGAAASEGPKHAFAREELQVVPPDTETP